MMKDTTKEAAGAAEVLLFDDWFDAIEDGVRTRVRGFIETMLEAELSDALSRPRYGRRKPGEEEAVPSVVGVRHGHRERTLTGTFGKTRIAVPRARLEGEDGKTREWSSGSLRAYQRRTRVGDALIAGAYLAGCGARLPQRSPGRQHTSKNLPRRRTARLLARSGASRRQVEPPRPASGDQRITRAPLPFMIASTSLTFTIEVSPGVVIANAPWAAPYSTADCGPLPSRKA